MKIVAYILISLGFCFSTRALSQNVLTSTLRWNSVSTFDAQNGMITDELSGIVSSPTHITWYAPDGSVKYNLMITRSDGAWANVSNNGSITYNVEDSSNVGVVQFLKSGNEIKIIIHFMLGDGRSIFELKVINVNTL